MSSPRTHEVDVIRLFALLGICIVNVYAMGMVYFADVIYTFSDTVDTAADILSTLFVEGKFITLFSFVLGWGIAVQEVRFTAAGGNFRTYYFRRVVGFLILGFLHAAFIFDGDVLVTYGLMSIVFWYLRPYVLSVSFRALVKQFFIKNYLFVVLLAAFGGVLTSVTGYEALFPYGYDEEALAGSFYLATQYRITEGIVGTLSGYFTYFIQYLFCFSCGYLAYYRGFFEPDSEVFNTLKNYAPRLLLIGWVFTVPYAIYLNTSIMSDALNIISFLLVYVTDIMIAAAYLYFMVVFARRVELPEILILAGRNSLSVYILQGVLASLFFNGYGLNFIGKFGTVPLLIISVCIYSLAVLIVGCYAKAFGHGILEPVMRKISGSRTVTRAATQNA
ncbi:DUF418 domain-containing protein [Leucothrix sargassi]|nr:DUF418 domain-containing protein [Leucothrix sargassi]